VGRIRLQLSLNRSEDRRLPTSRLGRG
jgi:hypothetical protein